LALAGSAGVVEVMRNLLAEFDLTMGLTGCATVAEITADLLHPVWGDRLDPASG
jgi:isopentenyl diphosphate isomerase/L-lactate dehydrogenase-like FMN-dependent dehydrogenase